ncbi:hypothetical protein MAPG_06702 [Magnaporthiopsis poae ATCC 64411]|uniref:Uncharacterized protein n=1 Tax=Magnaporthiopsis poae (strain ATCC 64411 / 73-15) TaxID=644358 RepID=A0A0C4E2R2_MAGP6|nr:hypothetical protein MAPG_06702 [Magnaporthiopsis poae ATCC 64411]
MACPLKRRRARKSGTTSAHFVHARRRGADNWKLENPTNATPKKQSYGKCANAHSNARVDGPAVHLNLCRVGTSHHVKKPHVKLTDSEAFTTRDVSQGPRFALACRSVIQACLNKISRNQ